MNWILISIIFRLNLAPLVRKLMRRGAKLRNCFLIFKTPKSGSRALQLKLMHTRAGNQTIHVDTIQYQSAHANFNFCFFICQECILSHLRPIYFSISPPSPGATSSPFCSMNDEYEYLKIRLIIVLTSQIIKF